MNKRIFLTVISQNSGSNEDSCDEMSLRISMCCMPQKLLKELGTVIVSIIIADMIKKNTDVINVKFFKLAF